MYNAAVNMPAVIQYKKTITHNLLRDSMEQRGFQT